MVHADIGDNGNDRVDNIRGVPTTENPDLDHYDIDGNVGKPPERSSGNDLEVAGAEPDKAFEFGDGSDLFGELLVGNQLTVAADPFVYPLEVWARICAYGEPRCGQQLRNHLRRRTLPVRPGHVDRWSRPLRVAHCFAEHLDHMQRRRIDSPRLQI